MQMYFYGIEYCITFDVSFTVLVPFRNTNLLLGREEAALFLLYRCSNHQKQVLKHQECGPYIM